MGSTAVVMGRRPDSQSQASFGGNAPPRGASHPAIHIRPVPAVLHFSDVDVMRAAKAAGLIDNKVCGFSATHTALKLVIPPAARG